MSSISEDPLFDGLNCLKDYIQKLNPNCEEFFQYPNEPRNLKMTFGMKKKTAKHPVDKLSALH